MSIIFPIDKYSEGNIKTNDDVFISSNDFLVNSSAYCTSFNFLEYTFISAFKYMSFDDIYGSIIFFKNIFFLFLYQRFIYFHLLDKKIIDIV